MGFGRRIATAEVVRRADEIADALSDALSDERRVPQLPIAQGDGDVFGNQVEENIGDEQIDLNAWIGPQERRYEFIKRLLPYGDGHRNPEQPLRLSLNLREGPFGIVELAEGFAALIEVGEPLRRQVQPARRALEKRRTELLLKHRHPAADRRHGHAEGAVNNHPQIDFAGDVNRFLDKQLRHTLTVLPGLLGDERILEHHLGYTLDVVAVADESHPAEILPTVFESSFAATTSVNLRFEHDWSAQGIEGLFNFGG